jgi:hypothetical protein
MVCKEQHLSDFKISTVRGGLAVEVPWLSANALRTRLRANGIGATACFDPMTRIASLEIGGNVDPECVLALLNGSVAR